MSRSDRGRSGYDDHDRAYAKTERCRESQRRYRQSPRGKYGIQKSNAKQRGIPWEFTFESWWALWEPHWEGRGCHSTESLVMCRHGDVGPYSPDNCFIDTHHRNASDGMRRVRAKQRGEEI